MSFWGVEVKPGKPFTHKYDGSKGRLHISMATLGFGTAITKSTLQCNVGNKSPVYLCSLYPGKTESLQLNLEFEEDGQVVFTVIGPRSIHLRGYYLASGRNGNTLEESMERESYGEDIGDTDTERSDYSDEDEYDDSFIDDGEEASYDGGPKGKKGSRRRLRKKYQLVESDDDGCLKEKIIINGSMHDQFKEIDNEDSIPISSIYKVKASGRVSDQEMDDNVDRGTVDTGNKEGEDGGNIIIEAKLKTENVLVDSLTHREAEPSDHLVDPCTVLDVGDIKKSKKKKKGKEKETKSSCNGHSIELDNDAPDEPKMEKMTQDLLAGNEQHQQHTDDKKTETSDKILPSSQVGQGQDEKPKKKRKERSKKETLSNADGADISNLVSLPQRNEHNNQDAINERNMEINECQPVEIVGHKEIFLGQVVNSKDEAYNLYQEHAFKMGFSVRKGNELYYDNEKKYTRLKDFYCSKQGFKKNESGGEVVYERAHSRTNCKAMVRFNVSKEGDWIITKLVLDHNHDFVPLERRHLLRSMRNMSNVKGDLIKSMVNAGIRVTNVWSYLGEEVGGFNNLRITLKDMHNYVYSEKLKSIEAGDAQSLVNHLQNSQAQDAMFYYSVQLDQESRLTNVFWRDGKSKVDYDCFGDVVIFDTTYRTNKYNLICAPFVGVNHHWQNVMFGCALLFDETAVSFTWLFKAFLESMGNQQPKTIFTDQDVAMAKAIGEVMPNTCHRLCLWHIAKNAPSHLGSLNSNHRFQSLFNKCMKGCDSEEEFQSTWDGMVNEYKLHDHQWLSSMYKIRHKWSTAYSKNVFSIGIKSSQRGESTNSVLGEIAGKTTSLTQFLVAFEKMVKKWRQLEVEKEFKNSQSAPPRDINISETLRHASTVYTHKIFKLFLNEYLDGTGGSTSVEIGQCDNVSYHEVMLNHMPNKKYMVTLDSSTAMISCSCHMFDSMGILCSHALRVYNIKNILEIPDQYFLKRWSKNARSVIYEHVNKGSEEDSTSNSMTNGDDAGLLYRNAIMKSFYNLVLETQENKEAQQIMWKWLDIGVERVHQCVGKLNLNSNAETIENNFMQNEENECSKIYNPLLAKTKGMSSVRKKGHFEIRKRSTTKAHKKNKEKHNEGSGYDAIDSPMGEQTNVLNCTNEPSGAVFASFNTPQQQQHPSCWGLNATSTSFSNLLHGMSSSN